MIRTRARRFAVPAAQYLGNLAILTGSMLVAVQFRLKLAYGKPLGDDYQAHFAALYGLIAVLLALAQCTVWAVTRTRGGDRPFAQFWSLLAALGAITAAILGMYPDLSQLQLVYFTVAGALLGLVIIVWPVHLRRGRGANSLQTDLALLWKHRSLLGLWMRYNIQSRYSQTILGILWIVLLPLSTAAVVTIAFTRFLRIDLDVPYVVFFLSALVPYGLFNQGVQNSAGAVVGALGLINQIYFPREILVLVKLGEALVDLAFTFLAMLIVNALYGYWPNPLFVLLPGGLLILVMFSLGIMLFVSCLSVLVRDVPQLVAVALQLLFYLTPILYPVENFPEEYHALILINPIAPVIQAFRDVILYGDPPDVAVMYYPLVIAVALLYTGYAFFKANEDRFADLQ